MTQRRVTIAVFIVQLVGILMIVVGQLVYAPNDRVLWASVAALGITAGLLAAYWFGLAYAPYLDVIAITLIVGLGTPERYLTQEQILLTIVPPALAMILAPPVGILASIAGVLLIYILRVGWENAYLNDIRTVAQLVVVIGSMYCTRLLAERALADARRNAANLVAAREETERRARALETQAGELEAQNLRQQQLLDLVATLETPTVALAEGVILAPLVGQVDSRRVTDLTRRLLRTVAAERARLVVLDIAGVVAIDSAVARALLDAVRAVRLLGCEVTITGISPSVAITLSGDGDSFAGVTTARAPRDALANYLRSNNTEAPR
jgi:anti-anti-sigma regulatory factor